MCVSALIVDVDNTILNVALPTLVHDLHATSSELAWIVDSYAMVFAGLLLVGRHLPTGVTETILGSLGGALAVAASAGGATGALLTHAARAAFMSGTAMSLAVGAGVAMCGAVVVLVFLRRRTGRIPDPNPEQRTVSPARRAGTVV